MREISLDRLRTLVAVADLGSLAAAARALHLAPPTVTLHVAELESRLGARLLVRGRGPVTPTGIGQALIERARRLLADADEAWQAVHDQVQGQRGRVRLGASTGAIAHLLPPVLGTLADRHPGIEAQLAVTTSAEAMARLAAGTLDVALVALPQPPQAGVRLRPWLARIHTLKANRLEAQALTGLAVSIGSSVILGSASSGRERPPSLRMRQKWMATKRVMARGITTTWRT